MTISQELAKLWTKVKDIEICMLVTADGEGGLRSRPMATQKKNFEGQFLFLTDVNSAKIYEIESQRNVNLSYAEPKTNTYISITGTASVVQDAELVKSLWNPLYKAWFPQGPEDPSIVVLQVNPSRAEYWDGPSSSIIYLLGLAKAAATGDGFAGEMVEHKKFAI
ncbi:MAG TPA: pyridoxamine 5'-phosphate oxidase family protein [Chroococcales cyanobacterium]